MTQEQSGRERASGSSGNSGSSRNRRRSYRRKRSRRSSSSSSESSPQREGGASRSGERSSSRGGSRSDEKLRENRERRRRRRQKARQRQPSEAHTSTAVEDNVSDLPSLKPVFIYTHVIRPDARDNYEFRTEHFSQVTRRLEDFHIDLSSLFEEDGVTLRQFIPTEITREAGDVEEERDEGEEFDTGDDVPNDKE